jgi:hypothetical protein
MTLRQSHSTRQSVILTRIFDYAALCQSCIMTFSTKMRHYGMLLDVTLLVVMRHFTTPPELISIFNSIVHLQSTHRHKVRSIYSLRLRVEPTVGIKCKQLKLTPQTKWNWSLKHFYIVYKLANKPFFLLEKERVRAHSLFSFLLS